MYREITDSEQKWPYLDQKGPNKIFWTKRAQMRFFYENLKMLFDMPIIPKLYCKTRKKRFAAFKMYSKTTDFEQKWPYLDEKGPNKIF